MQLILGDCLEAMGKMPPGSVDMVLCDLPYGVTANAWDKPLPLDALWAAHNRVVKSTGAIVLHAQEPFTAKLITSNLQAFRCKWIWYKSQISGFLNAKIRPLRDCEDIVVFYRKQCTYNPQMTHGPAHLRSGHGGTSNYYRTKGADASVATEYYPRQLLDFPAARVKGGHPTQKPVALLEYLIRTHTNPGQTVLDNCMGSGSTGVACINTGRDFIGIELDERYYSMAKRRIEGATANGNAPVSAV